MTFLLPIAPLSLSYEMVSKRPAADSISSFNIEYFCVSIFSGKMLQANVAHCLNVLLQISVLVWASLVVSKFPREYLIDWIHNVQFLW